MSKVLDMNVTEAETVSKSLQQGESLDTTDNLESLVDGSTTIDKVEKTPFSIVGQDGNYFVMCGKYRVSSVFDNKEDALKDAEIINWERIMQVLIVTNLNNEQ